MKFIETLLYIVALIVLTAVLCKAFLHEVPRGKIIYYRWDSK